MKKFYGFILLTIFIFFCSCGEKEEGFDFSLLNQFHYEADSVNIKAVKTASYHEFGKVSGNITISKGNISMEQGSSAAAIIVDLSVVSGDSTAKVSVNTNGVENVPVIVDKTAADALSNVELNIGTNDFVNTGVDGVAVIKNNGYETLQAAIDAAVDGDVIVLLEDIALGKDEAILVNKTVTLNLNGKSISGERRYLIEINGYLSICGDGTIASSYDGTNDSTGKDTITVHEGAKLDIYGGNFVGYKTAIYVNGGTFNSYGGNFTATYQKANYIVYLDNAASANIYAGNFTTGNNGCYGIYLANASEVNLGSKGESGPTINTWRPCIATNGSLSKACTINIYSGTYKANRNNTTIDDQTVIQIANASAEVQALNIYGGYFEQTSHLENSCIFTLKYSGMIKLNIMGGTFNYGNNSKLFCGYGTDASGYPSASNIRVNVQNDIIPKNVTIEVYGKGVVRIPERDFVVNQ